MPLVSLVDVLKRRWKWLVVAVPLGIVALFVGGAFVYIHFIEPDPAPPLAFSTGSAAASDVGDPSATAVGAIDGTWTVTDGSKVQYRVEEKLSGQDNTATGTSSGVTGTFAISGTTISAGSFTVDMKTFSSGESQRDGQFRNRIMETSEFPTATFELTSPIALTAIPDNLVEATVPATGKLTLHGTTKEITFDLKARRNGARIEVNGSVPVTFSDYGIDNPSGGPARVGDQGQLEFLLLFTKVINSP
jgi:polyisoprenoid-binding protein YceI